jgi:hypothetical protein
MPNKNLKINFVLFILIPYFCVSGQNIIVILGALTTIFIHFEKKPKVAGFFVRLVTS